MQSVLSAESAILIHFQSVGAVLLILGCIVISLLAFRACQCNLGLHFFHLVRPISKAGSAARKKAGKTELLFTQIKPLHRGRNSLSQTGEFVNIFLRKNSKFLPNQTESQHLGRQLLFGHKIRDVPPKLFINIAPPLLRNHIFLRNHS